MTAEGRVCSASTSGNCLQMTEGFTHCDEGECERTAGRVQACLCCGKSLRLTGRGLFPEHVPANRDRAGSGTRCTSVGIAPGRLLTDHANPKERDDA